MLVELPARGVRVGGVTVAPGEARAVAIALAPRLRAGKQALPSIPAWVVVGQKPGPRVGVVAAVRGVEATAARAAAKLAASLDPAALTGSVVVVPVLRARGRLAGNGRAGRPWRFPGDATGGRGARDAFTLFSDIVVGASALVVLAGPRRARRGAVVARGRLTDPRVRRLARLSGAVALLPSPAKSHDMLAAAAAAGIPGIELSASALPDADTVSDALALAARTTLAAVGVLGKGAERTSSGAPAADAEAGERPVVAIRSVRVRADGDGFLETDVVPGTATRARAVLGRVLPLLPGPAVPVLASIDGLVIEASPPGPVRAGATLFMLLPLAGKAARRHARDRPGGGEPGAASDGKTRVGWVEYVAFPRLGVDRLKAKIDTGARTSALHVARMRTVDTAGGPHRRPILEITVPSGARGRRPHSVRAAVHGFAMVRDTSGRIERRPVIETAVKLGSIERRIAVTLTNRGDMLFPALIGRTALGPGVVVDPSRRYLLGRSRG